MRELAKEEISMVSGGEITCTVSMVGIWCHGTISEWQELISDTYESAVDKVADFYEWVDETLSGDDTEEEK